jgi:ABC-type nitrate/sulfonate/bicarbonate transport system permease component
LNFIFDNHKKGEKQPMILVIVAMILAYNKAKATDRNAWKWAFITGGAFIGTQIILGFGIGIILGIAQAAFDWSDSVLDTYSIFVTIIAIVASFVVMWLILRYLDKVPEEQPFTPPPPPPNFH